MTFMKDVSLASSGLMAYHSIQIGWKLRCASSLTEELCCLNPEDMQEFEYRENSREIYCIWRGAEFAGPDFHVAVRWRRTENDLLLGSIEYSGNSGKCRIEEILFPFVTAPAPAGSRFLAPFNQGQLISCGTECPPYEKRCYYMSMQCAALFSGTDGEDHYYFDCRDPEHCIKQFDCRYQKKPGVFEYAPVHYVPLIPENRVRYAVGYECGIVKFSGSWYEAAQLYRAWALNQSWFVKRRISPVMRGIGIWVWNRGTAGEVIPPAERLQKDAGVPVALDWYWWHHNPYDTDYPDFWPPRHGVENFRAAIARLKSQNIFVQVYTNGMTWDIDNETYESGHGSGSIQLNRDGSPTAMMFNPYTRHHLAIMCGEAPEYQEKMIALSKNLASCGVPGLYLDMIGSAAFSPCFNPEHHHPYGGGVYQREGYLNYVSRIRRENPELLLSTEYANEMMDVFDSMIVLDSSAERCYKRDDFAPVPAYSAVYHGSGITLFGNYALPDFIPPWDPTWPAADRWKREKNWNTLFDKQFFFEMARTVVWGMQPCVCNLKLEHADNPAFAAEYTFILESARFYYAHRDFLYDGTMLSPEGFQCESVVVDFMKRGIFTRETEFKTVSRKYPAVLHSVWCSPAGRRALVAANYTKELQHFWYRNADGTVSEGVIEPRCYLLQEF